MIDSQQLVDLFLATANYIEQYPNKYNWSNSRFCNCGILASKANPELIDEEIDVTVWSQEVIDPDNYCLVTGVCLNVAVKTLLDLSFTPMDIQNIEYLGQKPNDNSKIDYRNPQNAIIYFRQKATEMQIRLNNVKVKDKVTVKQTVTC